MSKKLVIDGKEQEHPDFAPVKFDGDRIPLPARFIDVTQFAGNDPINCWLLVVTAGRYRLVPRPTSTPSSETSLARILRKREDLGAAGDLLNGTDSNEAAAIRARLIPTMVSPLGNTWRVVIPKEAMMLVPASEERSFVFVLAIAGFLEFWFPETLRRAVSVPITELLA